jgi:hypothetical protein
LAKHLFADIFHSIQLSLSLWENRKLLVHHHRQMRVPSRLVVSKLDSGSWLMARGSSLKPTAGLCRSPTAVSLSLFLSLCWHSLPVRCVHPKCYSWESGKRETWRVPIALWGAIIVAGIPGIESTLKLNQTATIKAF